MLARSLHNLKFKGETIGRKGERERRYSKGVGAVGLVPCTRAFQPFFLRSGTISTVEKGWPPVRFGDASKLYPSSGTSDRDFA